MLSQVKEVITGALYVERPAVEVRPDGEVTQARTTEIGASVMQVYDLISRDGSLPAPAAALRPVEAGTVAESQMAAPNSPINVTAQESSPRRSPDLSPARNPLYGTSTVQAPKVLDGDEAQRRQEEEARRSVLSSFDKTETDMAELG